LYANIYLYFAIKCSQTQILSKHTNYKLQYKKTLNTSNVKIKSNGKNQTPYMYLQSNILLIKFKRIFSIVGLSPSHINLFCVNVVNICNLFHIKMQHNTQHTKYTVDKEKKS